MIEFTIPGPAVPCPRPRVTTKGKPYYPQRYVDWCNTAAWIAAGECADYEDAPWGGPMWLEVVFHGARGNADLSNLVKSVEDALNNIVWCDDVQVERIVAEKFPVLNPRDKRTVIKAGLL